MIPTDSRLIILLFCFGFVGQIRWWNKCAGLCGGCLAGVCRGSPIESRLNWSHRFYVHTNRTWIPRPYSLRRLTPKKALQKCISEWLNVIRITNTILIIPICVSQFKETTQNHPKELKDLRVTHRSWCFHSTTLPEKNHFSFLIYPTRISWLKFSIRHRLFQFNTVKLFAIYFN